jgi:hypothetical protein
LTTLRAPNDDREHGMGIVVEYAGAKGKSEWRKPVWRKPPPMHRDYRRFADPSRRVPTPDEVIEMTFAKDNAATTASTAGRSTAWPSTWRRCR